MSNAQLQGSEAELQGLVDSLRERVQRLEDAEEIKRLQRVFGRQLADREWDSLLESFAPDAVLDARQFGPRRGHAQIAELFESMRPTVSDRDGYVLSSPVITVDGNAATGDWTSHRHVCEFALGDDTVRVYGPWTEGRYHCEYARIDGAWKFSSVTFRLVAPDADPATAEAR